MKKGGLGIAKKMKPPPGDIIWFMVNKKNGGKSIARGRIHIGELYNREDEALIPIHTLTNEQQGWIGDDPWDIQIHYRNLYMIEHAEIKICLAGSWSIMYYSSMKDKIVDDLPECFKNIQRYLQPVYAN